MLAAAKFKRQRQDSGDARHKAVRFPAIDMCNPRFPFRLLNQSEWHPDRRLSDLTGHSDAKVGKVCDACGPRMSQCPVDSHWSMAWHLHRDTRGPEQESKQAVLRVQFRTTRTGNTGLYASTNASACLCCSPFSSPFSLVFRRSDLRRPRPCQPDGAGRWGPGAV